MFVVGLDESKHPGSGLQDPVILDVEREAIGIPIVGDRPHRATEQLHRLLGRASARNVTLSYASLSLQDRRERYPSHSIREITRDANRFCAPHIRTVVAYSGDRAVAAAQTIYSHGIAGVFAVGTRSDARGKGVGDAVTRAVTRRAFEDGAAAVSLQASAMGAPIYDRMGYARLYDYAYTVNMLQP